MPSIANIDMARYQKFVNGGIETVEPDADLLELRTMIEDDIRSNGSFADSVRNLSENDKTLLLAGLITNDQSIIVNILSPAIKHFPTFNGAPDTLSRICMFGKNDRDTWFNATTDAIVVAIITDGNNNSYLDNHQINRMLTNAMAKIPDTVINVKTKYDLCKAVDPFQNEFFLEYREEVSPAVSANATGKVSIKDLNFATKFNKIDYSEYIMLTIGILQSNASENNEIARALNEARQEYVLTHYEKSISILNDLCSKYSDEIDKKHGKGTAENIKSAQSNSEEVDIQTNYSRRFFENKVAAFYIGGSLNLTGINEICKYYLGNLHVPASNATEAMASIAELADLPLKLDRTVMQAVFTLKDSSQNYQIKNRKLRSGFNAKDTEAVGKGNISNETFSRNIGTMKSNQPNYQSELSNNPLRNTNADINTYRGGADSYPEIFKRSAYVASLSGHAFAMVALLADYANNNKDSPDLEKNINDFIKAYTATYIGRGYHSLLEVIHVFNEPDARQLFKSANVNINLDWSDDLLKNACIETQSYSRVIALKRAVNTELLSEKDLLAAIKTGRVDKVKELATPITVNEENNIGDTALHVLSKSNHLSQEKINQIFEIIGPIADINQRNHADSTPLLTAIESNNHQFLRTVLPRLPRIYLNDILRGATSRNKPEIVKALLEVGANPSIASSVAIRTNNNVIFDLLKEHGLNTINNPDDMMQAVKFNNVHATTVFLNDGTPDIGNAFYEAVKNGADDVARLLLKYEYRDIMQSIALESFITAYLNKAVENDDSVLLNKLHDIGLDIKSHPSSDTLLAKAILDNKTSIIIAFSELGVQIDDKYLLDLIKQNQLSQTTKILDNIGLKSGDHSALMLEAVNSGSHKLVAMLIKLNVEFESILSNPDCITLTPESKKLAMIETLNIYQRGSTPLIEAIKSADLNLVIELINNNGESVTSKNNQKLNALHIAIINNNPDIVKFLLTKNKIAAHLPTETGETPLHLAVASKNPKLVELLLDHGAKLDKKNSAGELPLEVAIKKDLFQNAKVLVEHGASVDELRTANGDTYLQQAVISSDLQAVHHLLSLGAKLDYQPSDTINTTETPLEIAINQFKLDVIDSMLIFAMKSNDTIMFHTIIDNLTQSDTLNFGANINDNLDSGYTFLHTVVMHGTPENISYLLSKGATIQLNDEGISPIHVACQRSDPQIAEMILGYGFDSYDLDINMQSVDGQTALHIAVASGNIDTVKLLIDKGADRELVDNNGKNALDYAENESMRSLLIDASLTQKKNSTASMISALTNEAPQKPSPVQEQAPKQSQPTAPETSPTPIEKKSVVEMIKLHQEKINKQTEEADGHHGPKRRGP